MGDLAERRALAAMVMGDVVGYSRLMGTDEAGAVRRLKAYRTGCIDPIARAFRGRIVDAVGDSFLLEFASVVDATRGAIAIQQAIAERNVALPEEKRIVFRLGVNRLRSRMITSPRFTPKRKTMRFSSGRAALRSAIAC